MTFTDRVCEAGIVPVVVLNKVEDAVPLAEALLKGGISFMLFSTDWLTKEQ